MNLQRLQRSSLANFTRQAKDYNKVQSLSSQPYTHDQYVKSHKERQKKWSTLLENPELEKIIELIQTTLEPLSPEQKDQLEKIIRVGSVGLSEGETFKKMKEIINSDNETYNLFGKILVEFAQEFTKIREKATDKALIKNLNALIKQANLFTVFNFGIINKEIARHIGKTLNLTEEDLRHSAIISLITGFLKNTDICRIRNSGEYYKSLTLLPSYVMQSALRELQNNGRTIRLPFQIHNELNELRKLEEAYSKLPNNETKPKFLEYYAQEMNLDIEKAKKDVQHLRTIALFPLSLDYLDRVTYSDHRYGDESCEVPVELGNLIASTEPSPVDFVDSSLLQEGLQEILENQKILASEKMVVKLRYGIPLGIKDISDYTYVTVERIKEILETTSAQLDNLNSNEQRALELWTKLVQKKEKPKSSSGGLTLQQIGSIFNLSKERIRKLEEKALKKLREPYNKYLLRGHMYPACRSSEEIAKARENYLSNPTQNIEKARSKILILNNSGYIEASKKIIENYQALLKAQMQELLPNENILEKLLSLESPLTEVYMYLKTIKFKDRTQHEKFIKLLGIYTQSNTDKGKYHILKEGIDWKNKEQVQALVKNSGLTKETWHGFMEYLRNLSPSSFQVLNANNNALDKLEKL